jgi:acetyl-CoA acyltransferase
MRNAVIMEAVRTPVGKRDGGLSGVHPATLSAHVLNSLLDRAGVDPAVVHDVIRGCVSQVGEQTFDIARTSALTAGWPEIVTGVTVDRQCGSSEQSVHFAAAGADCRAERPGRGRRRRVDEPGADGCREGDATPFREPFTDRCGVFPNQGLGAEMIA